MTGRGNAKSRRMWRRKDIPNSQRTEARRVADWGTALRANAEDNGDWTWAPGIWAGVPPNSPRPTSNTGAQLMAAWETADGAMERAVGEWEGQTDGELAREVATLSNGQVVP